MKLSRLSNLLPPPRVRLMPWNALEVFAVFLLVMFVLPGFIAFVFQSSSWGDAVYGTEMMDLVRSTDNSDAAKLAKSRFMVPISVTMLPFQVVAALAFLRMTSDTRPYQLGLTTHRIGSNVLLGVVGWLILAPCVLALFIGVSFLFERLDPDAVGKHAFEQLSRSGSLTSVEFGLVIFLAMVSAPIVEELLFRGVLLGWLARNEKSSHVVFGWCLLVVGSKVLEQWGPLRRGTFNQRLLILAPVLFVLLLFPLYRWVCRRQSTPVPAAIFTSSLLFALVHSAWPAPVALFVLALGLGWLAWRTQSLIGPMVLHSLFNGIASVQLLLPASP